MNYYVIHIRRILRFFIDTAQIILEEVQALPY